MIKLIITVLVLTLLGSALAEDTIRVDEKYRQFMTDFCIECHSAKKTKGKIRLDKEAFSFDIKTVQDADKWQKILTAINAKEMPPEDEKQPDESVKADFLDMLSGKMVEARDFFRDTGGKTVMRRLNRREYVYTMKELLGVTVDATNLPPDQSSFGFDTDGGSLFMSSDQIEQYLNIARMGLERALLPRDKFRKSRIDPETRNKGLLAAAQKYKERRDRGIAFDKSKDPNKDPKAFGLTDKRDALTAQRSFGKHYEPIMAYLKDPHSKTGFLVGTGRRTNELTVPLSRDGIYKIRARVGLTESATPEKSFLDLVFFEKSVSSFKRIESFHITQTIDNAQIIEAAIEVNGSGTYAFRDKLTQAARKNIQKTHRKKKGQSLRGALWIDWVEVEGPLPYKQPKLIERISGELSANLSSDTVKKLIKDFAVLAFRNDTVNTEYLEGLFKVYRREIEAGKKPLQAIIEPFSMVLASPGFIYISEPSADEKVTELSQRELAVRLAYFLWSCPPDEELIRLAENGHLAKNEVLKSQVNRMLKDRRADNFFKDFTYQWLDMHRLHLFEFNIELFPHFDNTMKAVAAEEVFQTVKTVVTENLDTVNFLKSDFVVINGMLAVHYGIPNVKGDHFRKVKLPADSVRGGFTGMAAIHAMGSDGNKTSPVERGAWVLRKVLNQPPPPAPANVPPLARLEGKNLSARQIVKAHQTEAQCAHCHKKIDPVGFGLENFDPTGIWRSHEPVHSVKIRKGQNGRVQLTREQKEKLLNPDKVTIDASGGIHNGPKFKNYRELREIFVREVDEFNLGMISEMISYSLSRPAGFSDKDLISEVHSHMKENNNSMSEMIYAIVKSAAFKTKK
jgi:hypothetical protein